MEQTAAIAGSGVTEISRPLGYPLLQHDLIYYIIIISSSSIIIIAQFGSGVADPLELRPSPRVILPNLFILGQTVLALLSRSG